MEALVKSLLGKGEEHVYEMMQTMLEDAERVKCLDIKLYIYICSFISIYIWI